MQPHLSIPIAPLMKNPVASLRSNVARVVSPRGTVTCPN